MMSELGEGAKIPDLWRMSALLEFCPKGCEGTDVVEVGRSRRELREPQGEGDIRTRRIKAEQKETAVPMELDYVSGSEMHEEEEWDDVDEVRRDGKCHNCGMMGHVAWD